MKYCSKCGNQINDDAVVCLNCGCAVENAQSLPNNAEVDAPNTGMAVLGFFIPIVGLILYLIWKDKTPLKAKSAGKGALIGFIAGVVFSIIWGAIIGATTASYLL